MDLLQACSDCPQLLDAILATIRHTILITNADGSIEFASPSVPEVLGYTPRELRGKNLSVIFMPEDLIHLLPNLLYLAREGKPFEGELLLVRKNETRFFAFVRLRSWFNSKGTDFMAVITIEDIDKQKQLEKAFKGLHYEDFVKLAAGIAHELRNPLASIGGFVQRLHKEGRTSDKHDTYYEYIKTDLEKIEGLIKKVEFFAHLPKPRLAEESIGALMEAALKPFQQQLQDLEIDVSITLKEIRLRVDKELLTKAFSLMIENALDALPKGGGLLVFSGMKDNACEISLTDTGCGISPEDLPYIFNPFFSTKPDGAGIGLSVVKRIMESQGGSVTATSELGKGTTVLLVLPLERRRAIRLVPLEKCRCI